MPEIEVYDAAGGGSVVDGVSSPGAGFLGPYEVGAAAVAAAAQRAAPSLAQRIFTVAGPVGAIIGGMWPKSTAQPEQDMRLPTVFYHYTSAAGMAGIVSSMQINPSLLANNPNDARYGDGQYFSDLVPGGRTPAQLSRVFLGRPLWPQRYSNFVAVDLQGLPVTMGRDHVYLVPNTAPLNITDRLVGYGIVPAALQ